MNEQELLRNLLSGITAEEYPDEYEAYEVFEEELIPKLLANQDRSKVIVDSGAQNEFMGVVGEVLGSIATAIATVKTYLEIKKMWKAKKEEGERKIMLQEVWLRVLLEQEVGAETAKRIVDTYKSKFEEILKE